MDRTSGAQALFISLVCFKRIRAVVGREAELALSLHVLEGTTETKLYVFHFIFHNLYVWLFPTPVAPLFLFPLLTSPSFPFLFAPPFL